MKRGLVVLAAAVFASNSACAEAIPDYILNRDYETCREQVAKEQTGTPEQKEKYCLCIRENLAKTWDLEMYGRYVIGHVFGHNNSEEDSKMQEMAKQCVIASTK